MKEELINFKTAKLAKEKGFNIPIIYYYDFIKDICSVIVKENINESCSKIYSAPTQSLLQKWLREIQMIDIIINISPLTNEYYSEIPNFITGNYVSKKFETYEEALEIGLQTALKLIK